MKRKKKSYNTGGDVGALVGAGIGATVPGAQPFIPVLSGAGRLVGSMFGSKKEEPKPPATVGQVFTTQFGFKKGGVVKPKYLMGGNIVDMTQNDEGVFVEGPSHEAGGVDLGPLGRPDIEVEGREAVELSQGEPSYVFSDIKIEGKRKTFAQEYERLLEKEDWEGIRKLKMAQERQMGRVTDVTEPELTRKASFAKYGGNLKYAQGGKLPGGWGQTLPFTLDLTIPRPVPPKNYNMFYTPQFNAGYAPAAADKTRAALPGSVSPSNKHSGVWRRGANALHDGRVFPDFAPGTNPGPTGTEIPEFPYAPPPASAGGGNPPQDPGLTPPVSSPYGDNPLSHQHVSPTSVGSTGAVTAPEFQRAGDPPMASASDMVRPPGSGSGFSARGALDAAGRVAPYAADLHNIIQARRMPEPQRPRPIAPVLMNDRVSTTAEEAALSQSTRTITADPGATANQRLAAVSQQMGAVGQVRGEANRRRDDIRRGNVDIQNRARFADAQREDRYLDQKARHDGAVASATSAGVRSIGDRLAADRLQRQAMDMQPMQLATMLAGSPSAVRADVLKAVRDTMPAGQYQNVVDMINKLLQEQGAEAA